MTANPLQLAGLEFVEFADHDERQMEYFPQAARDYVQEGSSCWFSRDP